MSTINIHEYPTDSTLLPAYRIAVMQAALEGKEVEWRNLYFPSWHKAPSPCWDWVAYCYRITPPAIAPGHNPKKLTVDQIGEGYRTLSVEENNALKESATRAPGLQYWDNNEWCDNAFGGDSYATYRTTNPPGFYLPKKTRYFIHKDGPFRSCREGRPFYWATAVPKGGEYEIFFDHTDGHRHRATAYTLKEIECYVKDGSWVEFDGDIKPFLPKPAPVIAQGYNPLKLTEEQVGVKDGWRLLTQQEHDVSHQVFDCEYWKTTCAEWRSLIPCSTNSEALRTKHPAGYFLPKPPKQPETVMEWLLTLPKEYRVLAIRNMQETTKDLRRLGLPSAISSAFVWSGSPEGHEFWASVCTSLAQGSSLPPIPVVSTPKKLVPWTLETMVWPDCVRDKNFPTHVYGVQLANSDGLSLGVRPEGCAIHTTSWQSLYDECEYSVDHGKTWLPCGTWEEAKKS